MTFKSHKRSYGSVHPLPTQLPQQASQQNSMSQTLKDSVVGGFGTGIGFNIADRAISSLFGGRKVEVQHTNVVSDTNVSRDNKYCENILTIYKETLSKGEYIPQSLEERYKKCINV